MKEDNKSSQPWSSKTLLYEHVTSLEDVEEVLPKLLGYEDIPPWQQKIFSSKIAATGKQLKQSVKVFHSLILYRLLPVNKNIQNKIKVTPKLF